MIPHLIFNSNILKFQLIVLSYSVLVARQLDICDTDRGLGGGGRSDEKYCSLSCLLDKNKIIIIIISINQELLTFFLFSFFSDLFCIVYVTEQFLEL